MDSTEKAKEIMDYVEMQLYLLHKFAMPKREKRLMIKEIAFMIDTD